ncbi:MAG: ATP-grasp domain-containing protein [Bacillota bacterium]|nr:ATP-grasp domain-containing protein [Bacillota bacterium]
MSDIIITDIKYRNTIPMIRHLAKQGHKIYCVEYDDVDPKQCLGFYSKYCYKAFTIPDGDELIPRLNELCASLDHPILIAVGAKTLRNLVGKKIKAQVALPSLKALLEASDKNHVVSMAEKIGIPVPETFTLEHFSDLEELANVMAYPCIIKYKNGELLSLKPSQRYRIIPDRQQFMDTYSEMHAKQENPLVQQYIEGDGYGVSLLIDADGDLCDFICHHRLREYPVTGGPSCFCETVFDRKLLQYSYRLLREMNFCGVAMVEYKGTLEAPYLMEINPRFWGSSPLIAVSQSSFYDSLVQPRKIDVDTCAPSYKVGAKMRFTPQDFMAFSGYLKRESHKAKFFIQYVRSMFDFSVKDGIFSFSDMTPYFKYISNAIRGSHS